MAQDLQSLLEKINRDGVEKAEAESKRILADARAKAEALVAQAKAEAERARADAAQAADDYARRAAETVRQAARDTVLKVEAAVTARLEKLLAERVKATLQDPKTVSELVADAVRSLAGNGEIATAPALAAALGRELAALGRFEVVTDETLEAGFSVRLDGGRVEHTFTAAAIADELARRLRPDLAALLR